MILPLGLGLKIFRLPVITLILISANIIWYHHEGPTQGHFLHDVHVQYPFAKLENDLFKEFCLKKLGSSSCQIGKDFIHQKYKGLWPANLKFYATPSEKQKLTWDEFQIHLKQDYEYIPKQKGEIFENYKNEKQSFETSVHAIYLDKNLLSKSTINLKSIMITQFRHGSSLHLYSNLFFLLSFGIYAECALGSLAFLFIYFLGGIAGLGLEAYTFENSISFIVGASANVSALMGAFYILFFRHYFKAVLFLGFFWRTFLAPISYTLPILFFSQDLIGLLEIEGTNVAHLAHLGGLITGMVLTYCYKSIYLEIPEPFIYEYEFEKTMELLNPENNINIITEASHLIDVNPLNYSVKEKAINHSYKISHSHPEYIQAKYFLKRHFGSLLRYYYKSKEYDKVFNRINLFPSHYSFFECIKHLDLRTLGKLINQESDKNVPYTKFLLISSYLILSKSRNMNNKKLIEEKLNSIIEENEFTKEQLECIRHFNDSFQSNINQKLNTMVTEKIKVNLMIA
ncbi:rhomboid family intramembrane serine protease [Bacteriovoracaceae bacterium]|nr:rhomboid family intramembrane serine protease [Bacteriovoracaceae bacterium]